MFERRLSATRPSAIPDGAVGADADLHGGRPVGRLGGPVASRRCLGVLARSSVSTSPTSLTGSSLRWPPGQFGATVAAVNRLMPVPAATELLLISQAADVCVADSETRLNSMVPSSRSPSIPPGLAPLTSDARWARRQRPWRRRRHSLHLRDHRTTQWFRLHPIKRIAEDGRNQAASYSKVPSFRDSMAPAGVAPVGELHGLRARRRLRFPGLRSLEQASAGAGTQVHGGGGPGPVWPSTSSRL